MRDTAIASFCHYIFFFESAEAAALWSEEHPGTFVLSLERAFELGRKTNALVSDGMQAGSYVLKKANACSRRARRSSAARFFC